MKSIVKRVRIAPKKLNLIAGMVRNMKAVDALDLLKFTGKRGAKILYKAVKSALSNAENNFKQQGNELIITKILVSGGPTLKRSIPVSRGRMHPILKRTSHLSVFLGIAAGEKAEIKETKASTEIAEKTTEEKKEKTVKKVKKTSSKKTIKQLS